MDRPSRSDPPVESAAPVRRPLWVRRAAPPRHAAKGTEVFVVPPYFAGERLDGFLTRHVGERSRSDWQRLIGLGIVTVNGYPAKAGARVRTGDRVAVAPVPSHLEFEPAEGIPLEVVYDDPAMAVINKPAGLVVHPAPGHERGTLVNALLARFPELRDATGTLRPGIVHRLDKDTSGLLVIGKTANAVADLQEQMKARTTEKRYLVLVRGNLEEDQGRIEAPIGRDPRDRKKMAVRPDGRPAETSFVVRERFGDWTLVEATLHTGRTHQLRVHFAYIHHPVAGDAVYGAGKAPAGLDRQFVHAWRLKLRSPIDGRPLEFEAPLPPDLERVLAQLRRARSEPRAAQRRS